MLLNYVFNYIKFPLSSACYMVNTPRFFHSHAL